MIDYDPQNNCNGEICYMLDDIETTTESKKANCNTSTNTNRVRKEATKFLKLLEDVEQEVYPGCKKFSTLSFIVQLLNIKCHFGLSAKAIDTLLSSTRK